MAHLAPVDSASDSVGMKPTASGLHPANEGSFTYFYAFSTAGLDSAIAEQWKDTASIVVPPPPPPPPTLVNNINGGGHVKVYPNPARDIMNITGLTGTDRLLLYDMMGKEINPGWMATEREVNTFHTHAIPSGSYILIVKDEFGRTKAHVPLRKQ